jgi:hypothetical protein
MRFKSRRADAAGGHNGEEVIAMVFEALFGRSRPQKSRQDEINLLLEELRWGLTTEQVDIELDRTRRLEEAFERYWLAHGEQALAATADMELSPELLADAPADADGAAQFAAAVRKAVLYEVWLRDHGRCALTHRERHLTFERRAGVKISMPTQPAEPPGSALEREGSAGALARQRRVARLREQRLRELRCHLAAGYRLVSRYAPRGHA